MKACVVLFFGALMFATSAFAQPSALFVVSRGDPNIEVLPSNSKNPVQVQTSAPKPAEILQSLLTDLSYGLEWDFSQLESSGYVLVAVPSKEVQTALASKLRSMKFKCNAVNNHGYHVQLILAGQNIDDAIKTLFQQLSKL